MPRSPIGHEANTFAHGTAPLVLKVPLDRRMKTGKNDTGLASVGVAIRYAQADVVNAETNTIFGQRQARVGLACPPCRLAASQPTLFGRLRVRPSRS